MLSIYTRTPWIQWQIFKGASSRTPRGACSCDGLNDQLHIAAIGLEKRFAHEYSILCIHVWLLLLRLRQEGKEGAELAQMMYEDFQEDVEMRVRASGVKVHISFPYQL